MNRPSLFSSSPSAYKTYHTGFIAFSVLIDHHAIELPDHSPVDKEHIPVHLKSSSPLCSACENLASGAVTYLSEKQTQDKIMELLHHACSQSFSLEQKVVRFSVYSYNYG